MHKDKVPLAFIFEIESSSAVRTTHLADTLIGLNAMHTKRHGHNKTGKPFKHRRESGDSTEIHQILQDRTATSHARAQSVSLLSIPIQPFRN